MFSCPPSIHPYNVIELLEKEHSRKWRNGKLDKNIWEIALFSKKSKLKDCASLKDGDRIVELSFKIACKLGCSGHLYQYSEIDSEFSKVRAILKRIKDYHAKKK